MADAGFFATLNYSSQNEDWRTEAEALDLQDGERLLAITGSGDRALNPLAVADVEVLAVDIAPAQNHLLRTKIAAMQQLDFDDYVAFLGLTEASADARIAWSAALQVRPSTRRWLDDHERDVGLGLLYRGRFERWFRRASRLGHLVNGRAIDTLLAFDDLEAQRRFLAERWDRPAWRAVWIALCHPLVSRVFFGDPAFFRGVSSRVGAAIFDRMRLGLDQVLARDSFMVHLVLTGRLSPHDLPPYLREETCAVIRPRLERVHVVDGDVADVLDESSGGFDALSLSDLPSFQDAVALDGVLLRARDATRPGGRVVVRQFLTRFRPRTPPGMRRLHALEARLAARERTFSYDFLIYEVEHGPGR